MPHRASILTTALCIASLAGHARAQEIDFTAERAAVAKRLIEDGQAQCAAALLRVERSWHPADEVPALVVELSQQAERSWRQTDQDLDAAASALAEVYDAWLEDGRLAAAVLLLPDIARLSYPRAFALFGELQESLEPDRLRELRIALPHFAPDPAADVRACIELGQGARADGDLDQATRAWLEARRRSAGVSDRRVRRALDKELDELGGDLGRTIRELERAEYQAARLILSTAKRYAREDWHQTAASTVAPIARWGDDKAMKQFRASFAAIPDPDRFHLVGDRNLLPWLFTANPRFVQRGTGLLSPLERQPGTDLLEAARIGSSRSLHGTLSLRMPAEDCSAGLMIGDPGTGYLVQLVHQGLTTKILITTSTPGETIHKIVHGSKFERRPDEPRASRLQIQIHDGVLAVSAGDRRAEAPMEGFDGYLALAHMFGPDPEYSCAKGVVYESLTLEAW